MPDDSTTAADDFEDDLFGQVDPRERGIYNEESVVQGKSSLTLRRPIPVFGMRHVSHQGADPSHTTPGPRSKKLTETEARELILRHGLDTQCFIAELRRLIEIGVIPMTPDNIKKLVDAEKGNTEVLLRALDTKGGFNGGFGGDSKTIALQIINNVTQLVDGGYDRARERLNADKTIEASVVAIDQMKRISEKEPVCAPISESDDVETFVERQRSPDS